VGKFLDSTGLARLWEKNKSALDAKQDVLTGLPGQVVIFDRTGAVAAQDGWSNPNLIVNWDFRCPVNRNGETEYVAAGTAYHHCIDKWENQTGTVTMKQGYLSWSNPQNTGACIFCQRIKDASVYIGKTLTFSVFVKSGCVYSTTLIMPKSTGFVEQQITIEHVPNVRFIYETKIEDDQCLISLRKDDYAFSLDIVAVKLEFGVRQTLARQNADGKWELIDPLDYDRQYLLCSQYSPIAGEFVGSQHSNPNLLDNWYFLDPINQRGQEEYQGTRTYFIDKWLLYAGTTKFNVSTHSIVLPCETNLTGIAYRFEHAKYLVGQTCTFSAVLSTDADILLRITYGNQPQNYIYKSIPAGSSGCFSVSGKLPESATPKYINAQICRTYNLKSEGVIVLDAVKFELGPVQTLARKEGDSWVLNDPPPNRALELAKCQRYLQSIAAVTVLQSVWGGGKAAAALIDFPEMRTTPTLLNFDGITLRSANGTIIQDASFNQAQVSKHSIQIRITTTTTVMDKSFYICPPDLYVPSLLSAEL